MTVRSSGDGAGQAPLEAEGRLTLAACSCMALQPPPPPPSIYPYLYSHIAPAHTTAQRACWRHGVHRVSNGRHKRCNWLQQRGVMRATCQ